MAVVRQRRVFAGFSLIVGTSLLVACGQPKSQTKPEVAPQDSLVIAMTAPNTGGDRAGACLFSLDFSSSGDDNVGQVSNVHVIHSAGVSAESLVSSQNPTIKRIINPNKESGDESVPQFIDEVRTLISGAQTAAVSTNCVDAAKNLAQQLQERAKAVAQVKGKADAAMGLNFTNGTVCDYDCGITQPPVNYYNPYSQPYQYNKFGPTWAGGFGTPDSYSNSFFRNYYGGYGTGDVLYAGSWGNAIGNGLNRAQSAYDSANTVSTGVGGCQSGWGSVGGCVVGAVKALGSDMLKGAAVNGSMMLLGAGRFIPQAGIVMGVFEPKPVADGTLSSYCKSNVASYCGNYRYTYR